MSTTKGSMQKKLSAKEQNDVDSEMLVAIVDHDYSSTLDRVLQEEGADPNAKSVLWKYEKGPSIDSPLMLAIYADNDYAVKKLITSGANIFGESHEGIPAIVNAILKGNEIIVNTMLTKEPKLINTIYDDWTLLHLAILMLTQHSLIYDGEYESNEIKTIITKNYEHDYKPPAIPPNPIINYRGHKKIVSILLSQSPNMMNALGKDGITPLDIIKNPAKFKTLFQLLNSLTPLDVVKKPEKFKELFQSFKQSTNSNQVSTSTNSTANCLLSLEITLCNRYYAKPFSTTIKYDFTDLQLLFEKVENTLNGGRKHVDTQLVVDIQQQLSSVQGKLTEVAVKTNYLMTPKTQRVEWANWIAMPGHENLKTFYERLVTKFENTIMSFKAVDGGQTNPKEGKVATLKNILGGIADLVDMTPLVGSIGSALIKWGLQKGLEKIDESRELNTADQVGRVTWRDVEKDGPILARMLTTAFAQQLLELPTPEEAEKKAKNNIVKKGVYQLNALVLKGQFVPPAEVVAMVAMTWIVDLLYDTPDIGKRVQQEGLSNVVFSAIVGKEPPGKVSAFWQSVKSKLNLEGMTTKTGKTWYPEDIYVLSGIRTENGKFYLHPKSKPETYGWRLATSPTIHELKLTEVIKPCNLPPNYLLQLKLPQSLQLRALPFNPQSEEHSLGLPMPTTNGTHTTTALTFSNTNVVSKESSQMVTKEPSLYPALHKPPTPFTTLISQQN